LIKNFVSRYGGATASDFNAVPYSPYTKQVAKAPCSWNKSLCK